MGRFARPIRAILFDWDGTLLNSYDADARAYVSMFSALEIRWNLDDVRKHYSPNWYRVYRAARLPRSKWPAADHLWMKAYSAESPKLLPDARRILCELGRRYKLALVTSGNRSRVRRQLRELKLADYFSACVCSEDAPRRKPDPAPLRVALRRLRLEPEACIFVGDAPEDMQMAHRAGVYALGVQGPSPTRDTIEAAGPDALLRSISELPRWLRCNMPTG